MQISKTGRSRRSPVARAAAALVAALVLGGCAALQAADEALRGLAENDGAPQLDLPPAPRPELRAGDTFVYQGGRVRRVAAVTGSVVQWADLDGEVYRTGPHFFVPPLHQRQSGRTVTRRVIGDPSALWPLTPGRRVEFMVDSVTVHDDGRRKDAARRYWRCRVPGGRAVPTPAGTFSAYRVDCESSATRRGRPIVRLRFDFAPQIGHVVARNWRNARTGESTRFALEAALPAALATPERVRTVLARVTNDRSGR